MEIVYRFSVRDLGALSLALADLTGIRRAPDAVGTVAAVPLVFTYAPFMEFPFDMRPVDLVHGLEIVAVSVALVVVVAAVKSRRRAFEDERAASVRRATSVRTPRPREAGHEELAGRHGSVGALRVGAGTGDGAGAGAGREAGRRPRRRRRPPTGARRRPGGRGGAPVAGPLRRPRRGRPPGGHRRAGRTPISRWRPRGTAPRGWSSAPIATTPGATCSAARRRSASCAPARCPC